MDFNVYEAALVTFCEALQISIMEGSERLKTDDRDMEFYSGYYLGLYRVMTLLEQQVEAFGLSLEDVGFDKIKPADILCKS